jgi:hypothetical protein
MKKWTLMLVLLCSILMSLPSFAQRWGRPRRTVYVMPPPPPPVYVMPPPPVVYYAPRPAYPSPVVVVAPPPAYRRGWAHGNRGRGYRRDCRRW